MDRQIGEKQIYRQMDGQTDRWIEGWMNEWTDERMDGGQADDGMDEWTNGPDDRHSNPWSQVFMIR